MICDPFNFLKPNRFKFYIADEEGDEMFDKFELTVTKAPLPSVTAQEVQQGFKQFNMPISADRYNFENFTLTFLVLEDMSNYLTLYNWLRRSVDDGTPVYKDCVLDIVNSSNKIVRKLVLKNAFPTSLEGIEFDTQEQSSENVFSTVSFAYTHFEVT